MPVFNPCDNCGAATPIYRLAAVILDGGMAKVCPKCVASETSRIELPYAPRTDQGATQTSTNRDAW